jgi:hypothetical protein
MCVIALVNRDGRPTSEQIEAMWDDNPHGGGAAWQHQVDENTRVLRWKKGLSLEEMIQLNETLPKPYVLHFRVPSSDTSKSKYACHPFLVSASASYALEGESKDQPVLFHNGTWTGWRNEIKTLAVQRKDAKIPTGPWSDTRAMAWYAHHLGIGILEFVNEKVVVLGPKGLEIFGTWQIHSQPDKSVFLVSNSSWTSKVKKPASHNGNRSVLPALTENKPAAGFNSPALNRESVGGLSQNARFQPANEAGQPKVNAEVVGRVEVAKQGEMQKAVAQDGVGGTQTQAEVVTDKDGWNVNYGKSFRCGTCSYDGSSGLSHPTQGFRCWQCYSARYRNPAEVHMQPCSICKKVETNMRTIKDHAPICQSCNPNRQQATYYAVPVAPQKQVARA